MIDLLQEENLKKTFKKYLTYRGENSDIFALDDVFMKQPNKTGLNQQLANAQLNHLKTECEKYDGLFEQKPWQTTVLKDTFFCLQKTNQAQKTAHIFYINPNVNDRIVFVEKFLLECIKQNIAFDFEYTLNPMSKNGITVYAGEEQLTDYINVFDSLEKKYPQLIKRCGSLPICAQGFGWYAYKYMKDRTTLATYLGFSKTLVDYYNAYVDKTPADFIEVFYNICNQRTDKGYCGKVDDEYLHAKFVKNKDKIWQTLNKKKFSIQDIENDKVLCVVEGVRGHNIQVTPKYFVEALRQMNFKVDSFTQRRVLADDLLTNVHDGFKFCGIKNNAPVQIKNKASDTRTSELVLNLNKKSTSSVS